MKNPIKNLNVGTKLVTILVAPVVVLVVLAFVGVNERVSEADQANQVDQLAQFSEADAELAHQLQLESLYSAVYMSYGDTSADPALAALQGQAKSELDAQRTATDEARAAYDETLERTDPGATDEGIANALDSAGGRLDGLRTVRTSVDDLQTDPPRAVDQYASTVGSLVAVNVEVAKAAEQPELARGLASFVNLGRVKAATSEEASLLAIIVQQSRYSRWPAPTTPQSCGSDASGGTQITAPADDDACTIYRSVIDANQAIEQNNAVFEENSTVEQKQVVRDAEAGQDFGVLESRIIDAADDVANVVEVTPEAYMPSAFNRLDALKLAEDTLIASVLADASSLASDAQQGALLFAGGTALAIIAALAIAFFVYRSVTVPMRELTSAAYTLSTERLPALVERLRNPEEDSGESLSETLTPIEIDSRDEIGQLAEAFNSIQQVTIEVAEEQAQLLRKGIGDIFINLARRNQTLLDRQIEFIDQLEANEEDPDQLDNLFKLDHLATRMRRNAESLLVLAGAEPPRRRGRPVALADVVRVAIGEVEDFARIQLLSLDEATVGGNVAVDLAHLLSELMENATHFSPPDTMVEIVGHRAEQGYTLSVSDQGIGMSADQLSEANTQLQRPPLVGLALSRSLGFIVIGRLASRFDIGVKLTSSPSGGVTALVTLPRDIVTFEGEEAPPAEVPAAAAEVVEEEIVLEDSGESLLDELVEDEAPAVEEDLDREMASLVSDELPAPVVEPPVVEEPVVEEEPPAPVVEEEPPAPVVEEEPPAPVVEEAPAAPVAEAPSGPPGPDDEPAPLTAAGLVRRTPKQKSESAIGGGEITSPGQQRSSGQSSRSPEEIRKMLGRYRSGLNKGRVGADSEEST